MEPVAPGTEDETPSNFTSLSKQEKENERLLSLKAFLPNRQYGKIFDLRYVNGAEHWYCNACECPIMGRVFYHESGKRHKQALGNQNKEKPQIQSEPKIAMQIAPGEPVPPGFEEEVEKVSQIQDRLDGFRVGPLVALEYLLELQDYDVTKEPAYLCILCDKKGDPRTVLTHLASYNHILHYLQKHFPTCYRALAPYMTKQYKRNWQAVLHRVAEGIEKKFGRLKPRPIELSKFEKDRLYYLQLVAKDRHFTECPGSTFEEFIIKEELTKAYEDNVIVKAYDENLPFRKTQTNTQIRKSPSPPVVENPIKKVKMSSTGQTSSMMSSTTIIAETAAAAARRNSLSSVSSISSSDLSDFESTQQQQQKSPHRSRSPYRTRNRSPSPYSRRYSSSNSNNNKSGEFHRREKDLLPWERSDYRKNKTDVIVEKRNKNKADKLDEYKKLCKAIDNDMERVLKQHKKNPEKHPQYNDEWKKFWNRRYKELQAEGKDASNYDFKPEWIVFWNNRMIEIQQETIKNKKEALKKRLEIPDEPTPISFRIINKKKFEKDSPQHRHHQQHDNKPIPTAAQPDNDPEIIIIEDKDDESKSSKHSYSPWEDEPIIPTVTAATTSSSTTTRGGGGGIRGAAGNSSSRLSRNSRDRSRSSRSRDRSRDRRSIERSTRGGGREKSRERSWERERDYKKYSSSSYERDYRPRERIRIVSELPWEREREKRERKLYRKEILPDYYKPPAVMRDVTREPVITPPPKPITILSSSPPPIFDDDDGEINVVSVLRLLTALEEKLGSLGPKIIDLLAQALAMEKNDANSSENLLDNEINCVLFETVKEKLKGQLLAGLVEHIQERAFKNAIKKVASLIHLAGNRKKDQEKLLPKVDPVQVPGVGTVDKAAIAKQIANALILQGKTDVSQAELEQLINAVVGMAEASRNSNKPITTAAFLEQISTTTTTATAATKVETPKDNPVKYDLIVEQQQQQQQEQQSTSSIIIEKTTSNNNNNNSGTSSSSNKSDMESLSDSDLQTLLQNFKDLSTDEQHKLITYLKKLEAREPDRVEKLRKFVNLGQNSTGSSGGSGSSNVEKTEEITHTSMGRESPFSNRQSSVNPTSDGGSSSKKPSTNNTDLIIDNNNIKNDDDDDDDDDNNKLGLLHFDSDEEDYSYEDVVKAVSINVKQKELEKKREIVEESMKFDSMKSEKDDLLQLNETKLLITNLIGSSSSNNNNVEKKKDNNNHHHHQGILTTTTNNIVGGLNVSCSAEFAKTLNSLPVNMANLANIMGSMKSLVNKQSGGGSSGGSFGDGNRGFEQQEQQRSGFVGQSFSNQNYHRPSTQHQQQLQQQQHPQQQQQQQQQNVSYPIDLNKISYYGRFEQQQQPGAIANETQNRFISGGYPNRFGGGNERGGSGGEWFSGNQNQRAGGSYGNNSRYGNRGGSGGGSSGSDNNRW